jgi:hypothetical protein
MSNRDINETLEQEIGSFGGDDAVTQTPGLGKLRNKAAYGQKEDLEVSEQESLNRFLNKCKQIKEKIEDPVEISGGWIPVNREDLGIRSQFYPENWEFFVKPATMNAIKNWTAIDESKPDQVNRVFNEIIKQCVKIDTHALQGAGWTNVRSWDRFWFWD